MKIDHKIWALNVLGVRKSKTQLKLQQHVSQKIDEHSQSFLGLKEDKNNK